MPFEALKTDTPHYYYHEEDKAWFSMMNQGKLLPDPTWKFGVLYVTIKTTKEADMAIKELNNKVYVLFEPPFRPIPYQQILL